MNLVCDEIECILMLRVVSISAIATVCAMQFKCMVILSVFDDYQARRTVAACIKIPSSFSGTFT